MSCPKLIRASTPVQMQIPNTKVFGYDNPIWCLADSDLAKIVSTRCTNTNYLVQRHT
jgi:hypothetical protein